MLTSDKEVKGNLNEIVALINSFEEMILSKHSEIVQEMKVKAAKVLFSNVEYDTIMDQMVKEPKNKVSLIKAREIIVIGLRAIEVNETHIKVAVNALYNEEHQAKHEQFKTLTIEIAELISPRFF